MATGKRINIAASGFPGTNKTWRFIQEAFAEPLGALAQLAGNFTIVSGVVHEIVASPSGGVIYYSDGFVSINGEILPFVGGTHQAQCTIIETVENATYDADINNDGILDNLPTYITRYVTFGSGGVSTFNFAQLKRLKTIDELSAFSLPAGIVIDPNYIAFTSTLLEKLNSIQFGAQVNVKPNWNAPAGAPNEILNKPRLMQTLMKTTLWVFDVSPQQEFTVSFATPINVPYFVQASFESLLTSGALRIHAPTFQYVYYDPTPNGFKIRFNEWNNFNQGTLRIHLEVKQNTITS